jgi:thioredoxin-related protein
LKQLTSFFVLFIFLFTSCNNGQSSDGLDWQTNLEKAITDYAYKNLILVKLDFPRDIEQTQATKYYNNSLAQKYGIQGFPTILIFNSKGDLVAKTGYQPGGAANYVQHIKSFL